MERSFAKKSRLQCETWKRVTSGDSTANEKSATRKKANQARFLWSQIERVKKMQVRVIETKDEYEQAMFEVFAAYILNTPYNDFKPH